LSFTPSDWYPTVFCRDDTGLPFDGIEGGIDVWCFSDVMFEADFPLEAMVTAIV
jgi:hypothetical protein